VISYIKPHPSVNYHIQLNHVVLFWFIWPLWRKVWQHSLGLNCTFISSSNRV